MTRSLLPIALIAAVLGAAPSVQAELAPEQKAAAEALVARLSAERFADREDATRKLIAMGPDAFVVVTKTLATTDDPEVRTRCETVLKNLRLVERLVADLGPRDPADPQDRFYTTEKGESWAYVVKADGKHRLFVNGKPAAEHEWIGSVAFSAGGRHVAYWAGDAAERFVVLDGIKGPAGPQDGGWLYFSPEGRLAWAGGKGGAWSVVADGREGPAFEAIRFPGWCGEHVVCAGMRGGKWFAVVDGVEGPPHDRVWLSAGGPSQRYAVADGEEAWSMEAQWPATDAAQAVERRIELLAKIPRVLPGRENVLVTKDARAILLLAMLPGGWVALSGAETLPTSGFQVSPNGLHVAAEVKRGDTEFVLFDGKEGPAFEAVGAMIFSGDGQHLAFTAKRDGKWFVVRDGREGPAFDRIPPWVEAMMALSDDGRLLAHLAERGGAPLVVHDDVERPAPAGTKSLVLSPDGKTVLCRARPQREVCLWAGDRRTRGFEELGEVRFSRDSRHLAFIARRERRALMVVDGFEGPEHDGVRRLYFGGETSTGIRYFVVDRGRTSVVEVDWPSGLDWTNGFEPPK